MKRFAFSFDSSVAVGMPIFVFCRGRGGNAEVLSPPAACSGVDYQTFL